MAMLNDEVELGVAGLLDLAAPLLKARRVAM